MNDSEMLAHMGTDAMRWANEWCRIARVIDADGGKIIDEGWMVGWFANAMQAAVDAAAPSDIARERVIQAAVLLKLGDGSIEDRILAVNAAVAGLQASSPAVEAVQAEARQMASGEWPGSIDPIAAEQVPAEEAE